MKKFLLSAIVMISCIAHNVLADQPKDVEKVKETKDKNNFSLIFRLLDLTRCQKYNGKQCYDQTFKQWMNYNSDFFSNGYDINTDNVFVSKRLPDHSFSQSRRLDEFDAIELKRCHGKFRSYVRNDKGTTVTFSQKASLLDKEHLDFMKHLLEDKCYVCSLSDKNVIIIDPASRISKENPQRLCDKFEYFEQEEEKRLKKELKQQENWVRREKEIDDFNVSSY